MEIDDIEMQRQLSEKDLQILNAETESQRKSLGAAYFFYFLLGLVGGHKFYLGRKITGFVYIFLLWFGSKCSPGAYKDPTTPLQFIGTGCLCLLIVALFLDFFTMPLQVRNHGRRVKRELLKKLSSVS